MGALHHKNLISLKCLKYFWEKQENIQGNHMQTYLIGNYIVLWLFIDSVAPQIK